MRDVQLDLSQAREIDIDDAIALVLSDAAPRGPVAANADDWIGCSDRVYLFADPVHLRGHCRLPDTFDRATVVFAGGLRVDGVLQDIDGDDCAIAVIGDLRAQHVVCSNYWLVTGDVRVDGVMIGSGTYDYQFECDGSTVCDVLVESGYEIGAQARRAADVGSDPAEYLLQGCLDDGDDLSVPSIVARLKAGKPILKR